MLRGLRKYWHVIYVLLLVGFSIFVLLKTFVIPSVEKSDVESIGIYATEETETKTGNVITTENNYSDNNISIELSKERIYDTTVYIADIQLDDVKYLKTALAGNAFGRNINEKVSVMVAEKKAILAINGDFYGFRSEGYVARNGNLYRDNYAFSDDEVFSLFKDGNCQINECGDLTAESLMQNGAVQILSFGPGLVEAGEIDQKGILSNHRTSPEEKNPRTAIGMIEPLHYIFVVCDGRTSEDAGMTLIDLANVMKDYGCKEAYNLDGGGSSTMYFNGQVVNKPTDGQKSGEREVSDIVYIGY